MFKYLSWRNSECKTDMASSSPSSSFTLSSLFATAVLILVLSTAVSLKSAFHPRDMLPHLPRQVSWPILNSLYGAADLLPTFIGTADAGNNTVKWKGACFYDNTAHMEFHNKSASKFGGGTLHIKARSVFKNRYFLSVMWNCFVMNKA